MARASIATGLSLDEWAAILQIDHWDFNQIRYPTGKSAQCEDVIYQFGWQKDHLSREEIAEAIAAAERMIADELLYWPYPYYVTEEVIPYPRPFRRDNFGYAGTIRGEWKTIKLQWHNVISGGVFNRTFIKTIPQVDITFSDLDSDGIQETFTAVVTDAAIGTITDPYEIGLYFSSANRHGESISETWRVRPVTVSIAGNTATITGHKTLLVDPSPEFAVNAMPYNVGDAIYVTTLECYRVFTDATATAANPYQGVAIWKTDPNCTQDCTFQLKELCLGEHQNEQGQVFASFGAPSTWPYCYREPDRLEVNYVSGLPLVNGRMQNDMAKIVTYLSASLLASEKCGCDRSNRILAYWRQPMTRFEDNSVNDRAFESASNPFPMTRGGLWAWNRVSNLKHLEVVSL